MNFPKELKYTKDHEWAKLEGGAIKVGITHHAQSALGDIVFLELPAIGKVLNKGDTFGVVESVKAVSDLYAPIAGKVTEVHQALPDDPSVINSDPYGEGWLLKIEPTDPGALESLLDADTYRKHVESLA